MSLLGDLYAGQAERSSGRMDTSSIPKAWETVLNKANFLPVIVKNLERVHDTSWSMEPNHHDNFEMVYMKKGRASFEINGEPVPVGPNDIIIIKPEQYHKFIVESETGCEFIVLNFKFESPAKEEFSEVSLHDFLNFVKNREAGAYISLKVSQKNEIITLLNRILKERQSNEIESDFLSHLLVLELFALLSRALKTEWENSIRGKSQKLRELIRISISYIHNHFERDLSLEEIARYVFLSPGYFIRAFKEETGTSPISYLIKVRIDRAKELLSDTEDKIIDIALSVGFSNQQRFNEMFKKLVRMTPMQYRKSVNKHE
jgi:AraC-like DNA-binding protein/mannose-6-phosphate isomerase-like protein (cupin superfamily)